MGQDRVEAVLMLAQYDCDKCWQGGFFQGVRPFLCCQCTAQVAKQEE